MKRDTDYTALKRCLDFKSIVSRISRDILQADNRDLDSVIIAALGTIGRFCHADRAYVFLLPGGGHHISNTHEWCEHDITPQIDRLQNISLDTELPWFAKTIRGLQPFAVESLAGLPPEAGLEKSHFQTQGIQSLVVIPMAVKEHFLGFLGLDAVKNVRVWSESDLATLKITGDIFAGALTRRLITEERERLLTLSLDLISIAGMDGFFKYINPAWEQLLGYSTQELLSKPFIDFIHPDDHRRNDAEVAKLSEGHKTVNFENRYICKDGSIRHVLWTATPFLEEHVVYCIGHDITERKRAEERLFAYQKQLKSLASELTLTEERLKRTVAAELHDRISQSLAASKMNLASLQASITDPSLREMLSNIMATLTETLNESRSLTSQLSYPALQVLGLPRATEQWLKDEIGIKHGLRTCFSNDGQDKPLDEDAKAVLFRSIREVLNNIIKHAQARDVTVTVERDDCDTWVIITDDGIGFDTQATLAKSSGFGLLSIQESLERLGGHYEIDSAPGAGCTVILRTPLAKTEQTIV